MGTLLPGEPDKTIPRDAGSLSDVNSGETGRKKAHEGLRDKQAIPDCWTGGRRSLGWDFRQCVTQGAGSILGTEVVFVKRKNSSG